MPFVVQEAVQQVRQTRTPIQKNSQGLQSESPSTNQLGNVTPEVILSRAYPDLHIRRTLDQYFYSGIVRDEDQVSYREQRGHIKEEPKDIGVDQLWLWILNKGLVFKKAGILWY